jgi:hypothetical protein
MSLMYIREYADSGMLSGGQPLPIEPGTDQTPVSFTATAGQSAAFKNNTRVVRIAVDGIASIVFGTNPTAVLSSNLRMSAGQTSDFIVPLGGALKVSAVTTTV